MNLSNHDVMLGQNMFESSSTQKHPLGTRGVDAMGNVYRYVLAGAVDLIPGRVQQSPAPIAGSQAAAVNNAAGGNVAGTIQSNGYYLQILDPGAAARNARQTPIINLWYTDGGAVQQFSMASIDIL